MKKLQVEFSMDDLMVLMFAMRKAIHYTEWFDPTYFHYIELADKKKHLKDYQIMLLKLMTCDGYLTAEGDSTDPQDMLFQHPFNAKIVEASDDTTNEDDGKGK